MIFILYLFLSAKKKMNLTLKNGLFEEISVTEKSLSTVKNISFLKLKKAIQGVYFP